MVSRYPCQTSRSHAVAPHMDYHLGSSSHTRGSSVGYAQTPKERKASSQLLSQARKNQADKRRNQAACQSIQMPARKLSNDHQTMQQVQAHATSGSSSSHRSSTSSTIRRSRSDVENYPAERASVSSPGWSSSSDHGVGRRSVSAPSSTRRYNHEGERAYISAPSGAASTSSVKSMRSQSSASTASTRTSTERSSRSSSSSRDHHCYRTHGSNPAYDYDSRSGHNNRRRTHWDHQPQRQPSQSQPQHCHHPAVSNSSSRRGSFASSRFVDDSAAPPQIPQRQLSSSSLASSFAAGGECGGTVAGSLVSDLTEGRSLAGESYDDSLPIWGDHIDDQTAAPAVTTMGQRWSSGCDTTGHVAEPTTSQRGQPPQQHQQPKAVESSSPEQIEIMPGVWQPLRGTQETLKALECSFVVKPSCVACTMHLTCIANAEYVLCPVCRTVSPILGNSSTNSHTGKSPSFGVGYGVTDPTVQEYLS